MKKIVAALLLALTASFAFGQTVVQPGGATFDGITGTFRGFVNRVNGREETLTVPGQLRTVQATVPTCLTNCGTSPAIVGSDTAMAVTMGASGVPASGWVVTFAGTWAAAPTCTAMPALASMVIGKLPIAIVTTATTATVTTNGVAPANSDVYFVQCLGVK